MDVKRFVKWLRRAGKRGRTMEQYVEMYGDYPIRTALGEAARLGHKVDVVQRRRGEACNHHRLMLVENDDA